MTLHALLRIAGRRWYVILVVLGGTAALAVQLVPASEGVYSTRTTVTFLYSFETTMSLNASLSDDDVIAFAGAVAADVVPGREAVRYSAADAPYYGAGLREGVLVGLVDYGNQWTPSYGAAVIEIQIVGPTHAWVEARQRDALDRILNSPYVLQQPGDITDLTPRVDPLSLRIDHITPSRRAQAAAFAALAGAGLLTAGALAVAVDRAVAAGSAHRRNRRGTRPDRLPAEENA